MHRHTPPPQPDTFRQGLWNLDSNDRQDGTEKEQEMDEDGIGCWAER